MNETQMALYTLKKAQDLELRSNFSTEVAEQLEFCRDTALAAWCTLHGGKQGQRLLEILMKQISAVTNMVELLERCGKKRETH